MPIATKKSSIAKVTAIGAITLSCIAMAVPTYAAQSNVGGWTAGTVTCANGAVSVFPVIVGNGSAGSRTGSYTIPSYISAAVQVAASPSGINCNGTTYTGRTNSANFTVPAGGTTVLWVGLGTTGQTTTGSHNIGFGGLPSGSRGQVWYDLGLTLNNAVTAINGGNTFNNLTATYQNTGGLDANTNGQNLFNLTNCVTTNDGSILPGSSLLTPFNGGAWTSGPVYGANQPLCAAWAPEGTSGSYTQGTSTNFAIQAAQSYSSGAMLAMAGSGSATITSASFAVNYGFSLVGPTSTNLPINTPQSGPWLGQDPQTGQWFVANMEAYGYPVSLIINGQLVGTAS